MEKDIPNISESEWKIMKVLWDNSPQTANDIILSLQESTDWKPKTIRTLLDRLVQKGVVGVNKNSRIYTFYPVYIQEDCQRAETESFIKRIYGSTLKFMLAQLIQEDSLSKDDIDELRFILDKKAKTNK